jgi:hypothetical protein
MDWMRQARSSEGPVLSKSVTPRRLQTTRRARGTLFLAVGPDARPLQLTRRGGVDIPGRSRGFKSEERVHIGDSRGATGSGGVRTCGILVAPQVSDGGAG